MDKKYQVIWANIAEIDLINIVEYIAKDNPSNALTVLKKIKKRASSLNQAPNRGRIIPELRDFGIFQYRELIIRPWRMIYRISENRVFILSIFDSRQNVEDILLKRFINLGEKDS